MDEARLRHAWASYQQQARWSDARIARELGIRGSTWAYWRAKHGYRAPFARGRERDASRDFEHFSILVRGMENGINNRAMAKRAGISYRMWMRWREQVGLPARGPRKRAR